MNKIDLGDYMIHEHKELGKFYIYKANFHRKYKWLFWKSKKKTYTLVSSQAFDNLADAMYYVKTELI